MTRDSAVPLENFIQAVQGQLDKAQTAMAVKARNLNLPLTFAIKDITLDLRAQVEYSGGEIRIRPAGPADTEASVFHLVFTAITRPAIEENAVAFAEQEDEDGFDELPEEDRRKLEWSGIRSVRQLEELERTGLARTVSRVTNLPIDRLRQALSRASAPMVHEVLPVGRRSDDPEDAPPLMRVRGRNFQRFGPPRVSLGGEPVAIVKASDGELLLAPAAHQWAGELALGPDPLGATAFAFDLRPFAPRPAPKPNGHDGEARP